MTPYLYTQHKNQLKNLLEYTWFTVSGLETTEPRLGLCNIAGAQASMTFLPEKDKPDKRIFEVYQKFFLSK